MSNEDPRDVMIQRLVKGRSFVDVGGLWGTVSEKVSVAYRAGAAKVAMLDITPPGDELWQAFERRMLDLKVSDYACYGNVNVDNLDVAAVGGPYEVVHCSGVLYHCPNPLHTLKQLASLTREYLILTSTVIPKRIENEGGQLEVPHGGMLLAPTLGEKEYAIVARYWKEKGVPTAVETPDGARRYHWDMADYGPWWWFIPRETLMGMMETAGLKILMDAPYWGARCHTVLSWQSNSADAASQSSFRNGAHSFRNASSGAM
ncbi:MAG TPA: methyltransferase domain-containing protein [Gemmataceae bacterium]|nr:methyltransferase domain-containing protein [Gemmataceae bacterium]